MLENIKLGMLIVSLLPGFIFVQAREHHLLREKRPQFEKTLEIILDSCFIWIIALASPVWWPWDAARERLRAEVVTLVNAQLGSNVSILYPMSDKDFVLLAKFFLSVCCWSFVAANFWGLVRKNVYIDAAFTLVTGRSWYPSVKVEFFKRSLNNAVRVETSDMRYLGVLFSAPDTADGEHIILRSVALLPKDEPGKDQKLEPLPLVEEILVKIDDVTDMQLIKPAVLKKKKGERDANQAS